MERRCSLSKQCRVMAEDFKHARFKDALLRVAAEYDKMAEQRETMLLSHDVAKSR